MTQGCRIILADDHLMFRTGLRTLIEREEEFCVADEAADGIDLLEKVKGSRCDLVLLDLSMPRLSGLDVLPLILKRYPRIKILVLTMQKDIYYFQKAMALGAAGYLLKDDAFEQLVQAMKIVIRDQQFISPSILRLVREQMSSSERSSAKEPSITVLTKREQQVLRLIAAGLANKNIADQLNISIRTVEVHRSNLTKKLRIRTTAGLVRYALEHVFINEVLT